MESTGTTPVRGNYLKTGVNLLTYPLFELRLCQVVPFNDQIAVKPGLLALPKCRQLAVELQGVVRDRVVIALNRGLSFELQNRHLWSGSYEFGGENGRRLDHC